MRNIDQGTYKAKTRKNILHDLGDAAYLPSHALMLTKRSMLVDSLQPSVAVNIELALQRCSKQTYLSKGKNYF